MAETRLFHGYRIHLHGQLRLLSHPDEEHCLVLYGPYRSICTVLKKGDNGRLRVEALWGIRYELAGRDLHIYDKRIEVNGDYDLHH